jgi:predicted ATPase
VTNGKPALEGTEQMRQGLAAHRASGTQALVPHFMALLADAFGRSGQVEEALRLSEEALSIADHNGERYYQAELYRIKGELLFLQATGRGLSRAAAAGDSGIDIEPREVAHAEDCLRRSIELARQQKANSWELRAMMSLAHLLEGLGRKREAIDGLTKIRNAFTEGSDTVDLREAGALLESLS